MLEPSEAAMKQTQRTVVLSGLFALSLIACSGGNDGTTPLPIVGGQSLSIEVNARSLAMTVFVNASNGNLLESKTVNANAGRQTLVFNNVPSGATMTRAFQGTTQRYNATTKQYVSIPYISLGTYSLSEAVKYIFGTPSGVVTQPLLSLYAKFTARPTLTGFSSLYALGNGVNTTGFAADGTLGLKSPLYQSELQDDTNFSTAFLAFNGDGETIGYITYLDKPVPAAENSLAAPDFTVTPADWKTDLTSVPITINNLEPGTGPNYEAWVSGSRKGIAHSMGYGQKTVDAAANSVTINAKHPPVFFDTYNYTLRYFAKASTQAGQPSKYHGSFKRGFLSLPANPTFNAQTDFLTSPSNLGYSETGRPTLTWTYTTPASVFEVYAGIDNQTDDADLNWFFDSLPKTASSLTVPALPASLATWDPKGNARQYRFYVNASEYNPTTQSPGGNRYSGASRNFSNDIGTASLGARAVNARQRELQDEPNNLDEIKRH
jgi:hypothetical protein